MSDGATNATATAPTIPTPPRRSWSDRLNPIVVKEVRQAMRGRYFRVLFWVTLTCAVVIALTVVAFNASGDQGGPDGREVFIVIVAVLAVAVHAFVPFSAFLATSAEWDENTWDLLVISNLRPRQIVTGKLLSAVIQAVLFYSAFAPFLVFAFLLNGVDLLAIALILPTSLATCAALSLVGIALSSLSRVRYLRILLMALFGGALMLVAFGTIGMAWSIVQFSNFLRDPDSLVAVAGYLTGTLVMGGLAFATAVARFAHEEENRSTALRVTSFAIIAAAAAWSAWAVRETGEVDQLWICHLLAAIVVFIPLLLFATEEDALRRGVAKRVPKNRLLALLTAPFQPGGGRGVLLVGVLTIAAVASVLLSFDWNSPVRVATDLSYGLLSVAVTWGYVVMHIGVISGLGSFLVRTPRGRTGLRWLILASVPFAILLPGLIGLFLDIDSWRELRHPFNPIHVLGRLDSAPSYPSMLALVVLGLAALAALVLNLGRVIEGLREVLVASRARRTSDATRVEGP